MHWWGSREQNGEERCRSRSRRMKEGRKGVVRCDWHGDPPAGRLTDLRSTAAAQILPGALSYPSDVTLSHLKHSFIQGLFSISLLHYWAKQGLLLTFASVSYSYDQTHWPKFMMFLVWMFPYHSNVERCFPPFSFISRWWWVAWRKCKDL